VAEFMNEYTDTEGEYACEDEPKVKKNLHWNILQERCLKLKLFWVELSGVVSCILVDLE
jgi:hypothetical protein